MRRVDTNKSRAGFTLVEMMVALVAGAMAITSIYFISASSSRHFHEQQRIAQSQMALRMAMNQLRRDIERAGYLGTPNSDLEQQCVAPSQRVQAIALTNAAGDAALTNATTNGVHADDVVLTGNYVTGDAYLIVGLSASGDAAFFQTTWQGFRRSFGVPYDSALFDQVFVPGRWLQLTTQDGNHFFVEITASDGTLTPPMVSFTPALPVGAACLQIGTGATVAPLSRMEYLVMAGGSTEIGTLASASALAGINGPTLVRRELKFDGTPVAGSERVVAEYVADFDVDMVVNTAASGVPVVLARQNDAAAAATIAATPNQARSAIVRLSIRTPTEDERFPFVARAPGDPLTRYELDDAADGAARVRTESAEILLPNVAYRNLNTP